MEVRKKVSARRWLESINGPKSPPGIASHYLQHFAPAVHGTRVVLYCRVSTWEQYECDSLAKQIRACVKRLEALGVTIVKVVSGIECSWRMTEHDRSDLSRAIKVARKHGAVVVAASTSRFIRSAKFDANRRYDAQPTVWEFERLKALAGDVTLATLDDPDDSASQERSHQTKRGLAATNAKLGRPPLKKNRRERLQPEAIELRRQGLSLREIAEEIDAPLTTVRRWVTGCTVLARDP